MVDNELSETNIKEVISSTYKNGIEWPVLLWDKINCSGSVYPAENTFIRWDEWINFSDLNMSKIKSIFIPGHVSLQLKSYNNGYCEISGYNIISDTDSRITYWGHADKSECSSSYNNDCGKKINWTSGIYQIRFHRDINWFKHLHDLYIDNPDSHYYVDHIDLEDSMNDICDKYTGDERFNCQCINGFNTLKYTHPDIYNQLHLNNIVPECDPNVHPVPALAKIGKTTNKQCQDDLHTMIKNGTFKFLDQGGDIIFKCGTKQYTNINSNGTYDEDVTHDYLYNRNRINNNNIGTAEILICGVTMFIILIMFYFYCNYQIPTIYSNEQINSRFDNISSVKRKIENRI